MLGDYEMYIEDRGIVRQLQLVMVDGVEGPVEIIVPVKDGEIAVRELLGREFLELVACHSSDRAVRRMLVYNLKGRDWKRCSNYISRSFERERMVWLLLALEIGLVV
jgi:hypothetical protein